MICTMKNISHLLSDDKVSSMSVESVHRDLMVRRRASNEAIFLADPSKPVLRSFSDELGCK